MANKFWVNGSGTWDTSTTTHWSTSSGGSGGAAVPTSSDNVFFDASSGAGTVTLTGALNCANIDASASTILTFTGSGTLTCAGNFTLKSGLTVSGWTGGVTLTGTGAQTTTFAGNTMAFNLTLNSVGGTYTLQDALAIGSGHTLFITQGTINANGNNVTVGLLASTVTNTRAITMGTGTWTLTGNAGNILLFQNLTGFTFTPGNAFVCNYSGSSGTRTMGTGAITPPPSFQVTAGTDTIITNGNFQNIDCTGFAGTIGAAVPTIYGNLTVPSGVTWTTTTNIITFASTSGTSTVSTNGATINQPIVFNGVGGTWQLLTDVNTTNTITLTNGTFDANNNNVTARAFLSTSTNTRSMLMGSGTWTITSTLAETAWSINSTGLTVTPSTSTIKINGSTANIRTFTGGVGVVYNNIWITNATSGGEVDFSGTSTTFNDFKQQDPTPQTIKFAAGLAVTVNSWSAYGTASNLLTLSRTGSGTCSILKNGPPVCVDYMSIDHCVMSSSGAAFYAGTHSTNGGTNTRVIFAACPQSAFLVFS